MSVPRRVLAQLTARGLDELGRALPRHAAVLERHLGARLDDSEADSLVALVRDLAARPRPPMERRPVADPPTPDSTGRGR